MLHDILLLVLHHFSISEMFLHPAWGRGCRSLVTSGEACPKYPKTKESHWANMGTESNTEGQHKGSAPLFYWLAANSFIDKLKNYLIKTIFSQCIQMLYWQEIIMIDCLNLQMHIDCLQDYHKDFFLNETASGTLWQILITTFKIFQIFLKKCYSMPIIKRAFWDRFVLLMGFQIHSLLKAVL